MLKSKDIKLMDTKERIAARQAANREILALLSELVEKCPDERFHQILFNCSAIVPALMTKGIFQVIEDEHSAESVHVLERIRAAVNHVE